MTETARRVFERDELFKGSRRLEVRSVGSLTFEEAGTVKKIIKAKYNRHSVATEFGHDLNYAAGNGKMILLAYGEQDGEPKIIGTQITNSAKDYNGMSVSRASSGAIDKGYFIDAPLDIRQLEYQACFKAFRMALERMGILQIIEPYAANKVFRDILEAVGYSQVNDLDNAISLLKSTGRMPVDFKWRDGQLILNRAVGSDALEDARVAEKTMYVSSRLSEAMNDIAPVLTLESVGEYLSSYISTEHLQKIREILNAAQRISRTMIFDFDGTLSDEDAYHPLYDFAGGSPEFPPDFDFISAKDLDGEVLRLKPKTQEEYLAIAARIRLKDYAGLPPYFGKRHGYTTAIISAGGFNKIWGALNGNKGQPITGKIDYILAPDYELDCRRPVVNTLVGIRNGLEEWEERGNWRREGIVLFDRVSDYKELIPYSNFRESGQEPDKSGMLAHIRQQIPHKEQDFIVFVGDDRSDISVIKKLNELAASDPSFTKAVVFADAGKALHTFLEENVETLHPNVHFVPFNDMLQLRLMLEYMHKGLQWQQDLAN